MPEITCITAGRSSASSATTPARSGSSLVVPVVLTLVRAPSWTARRCATTGLPLVGSSRSFHVPDHLDHDAARADRRTLGRFMTTPIAKLDLVRGYALAFAVVAVAQTSVSLVAFRFLGLDTAGRPGASSSGDHRRARDGPLAVSPRFAPTEFQAVQFMPAGRGPAVAPLRPDRPADQMARLLEIASAFLPLTYAYDALHRVGDDVIDARLGAVTWRSSWPVTLLALALAAATLRRQTP